MFGRRAGFRFHKAKHIFRCNVNKLSALACTILRISNETKSRMKGSCSVFVQRTAFFARCTHLSWDWFSGSKVMQNITSRFNSMTNNQNTTFHFSRESFQLLQLLCALDDSSKHSRNNTKIYNLPLREILFHFFLITRHLLSHEIESALKFSVITQFFLFLSNFHDSVRSLHVKRQFRWVELL